MIATDISIDTKNIAYFQSKFQLDCKGIFLFNKPCSKTVAVAYEMPEGIKDGFKVSAKSDTLGLFSRTHNTKIGISNKFANTEVLKNQWCKICEIIGEEMYDKIASYTDLDRELSNPVWITQSMMTEVIVIHYGCRMDLSDLIEFSFW